MASRIENQHMTRGILEDYIPVWVQAFLTAKHAGGMTKNTIDIYTRKLKQFDDYCESQAVRQIEQITPSFIREWLLYLEDTGHNPGGRHSCYRALRAFLYWYEQEVEPTAWSNPIKKVGAPRVALDPMEGVSLAEVLAMAKVCERGTFTGDRDHVRRSKGQRARVVFLGRTARKALRQYLKHRQDNNPALWMSREGERLAYQSLRGIVARHAKQAGIPTPSLHDFWRGFALLFLKNGGDIFTLARLLGHKGIDVLKRYLAQTDQDAQQAHAKHSPVDMLNI